MHDIAENCTWEVWVLDEMGIELWRPRSEANSILLTLSTPVFWEFVGFIAELGSALKAGTVARQPPGLRLLAAFGGLAKVCRYATCKAIVQTSDRFSVGCGLVSTTTFASRHDMPVCMVAPSNDSNEDRDSYLMGSPTTSLLRN